MTITIVIETDNAAFEEDLNAEVARILEKLADYLRRNEQLEPGFGDLKLFDYNGKKVGTVEVDQ